MTGYESKRAMARDRMIDDDDIQIYKRPWVGLTDEDWKEIEDMPDTFDQGVAWAQAKLKEKNT
jgi:hypothetical protein